MTTLAQQITRHGAWALVALGGAGALATIALHRGETVNACGSWSRPWPCT